MAVPQLASNEPALHTSAPNQFALKHIAPNLAIPPLIPSTGISASHGPFRGFPTPRCRDAPSASPIELSPIEFTGPRPDGSSPDTVFSRQRTASRSAHGSKVKGLTQTRHCRLSSNLSGSQSCRNRTRREIFRENSKILSPNPNPNRRSSPVVRFSGFRVFGTLTICVDECQVFSSLQVEFPA